MYDYDIGGMSMNRVLTVLVVGVVLLMVSVSSDATMFVATAKNLRGALYLGVGPTPGHAAEQAIVKCSQDSFIPPSCKVICVRMECPPPLYAPPVRKPIKKSKVRTSGYPATYSWGMPRP
jgi:hypothetical protein